MALCPWLSGSVAVLCAQGPEFAVWLDHPVSLIRVTLQLRVHPISSIGMTDVTQDPSAISCRDWRVFTITNPLHDVSTVDSPGNNTRSESSGNTAAEPVLHSLNGVTTCRETGKACQLVGRPRAPTFTGAGIACRGRLSP